MANRARKVGDCGLEPGDRCNCACVMLFVGRLQKWPIVTVAVTTGATGAQK